MSELGLKVPNPYYDEWLDVIFQARVHIFDSFYFFDYRKCFFDPLKAAPVNNDYFGMLSSFGCTSNGSGRECRDAFTKFLDVSRTENLFKTLIHKSIP